MIMNDSVSRKCLVIFSIIFSLQYCAVGQTTGLLGSTNNEVSAETQNKEADIRKLISVAGSEDILRQTLPKMVAQMKLAMPQVPDEAWHELEKPETIKKLVDLYVPIYEKHFTHDEIRGMLNFYETPLGKKMVTTMPLVLQESMDAGNRWGIDLAKRIGQGTNQPTPDISTSRRPLTEGEKNRALIAHGYDPNNYRVDDDGNVYQKEKPVEPESKAASLPPDVHYVIEFNDTTYFSKEEPKPFGNGFKFKIYPTEMEMTVSGNVQITKIPTTDTSGK
jgi:uncharacterized protein